MSSKRGQSVWNARNILSVSLGAALVLALSLSAAAQSLNPRAPTPMVAGENRGTLDCMVGPQYWSFKYRKGSGKITVGFTSMGLFGNPMTTTIEVVLHGPNGQVIQSRSLTSNGRVAQLVMPGTFAGPGSAVIELKVNGTCLVRAGGDYTVIASGDGIDFGGTGGGMAAGPRSDPIVGTYAVMVYPPDWNFGSGLSIRFAANGTVQTSDGHSGTWQAFDPGAMIYTVVIGPDRWSLKLKPGLGLCNTTDLSVLVFQAVR
ncbi:MAG: hypothetical protein WAK96_06080 [Desulfobaccales bacterium]